MSLYQFFHFFLKKKLEHAVFTHLHQNNLLDHRHAFVRAGHSGETAPLTARAASSSAVILLNHQILLSTLQETGVTALSLLTYTPSRATLIEQLRETLCLNLVATVLGSLRLLFCVHSSFLFTYHLFLLFIPQMTPDFFPV